MLQKHEMNSFVDVKQIFLSIIFNWKKSNKCVIIWCWEEHRYEKLFIHLLACFAGKGCFLDWRHLIKHSALNTNIQNYEWWKFFTASRKYLALNKNILPLIYFNLNIRYMYKISIYKLQLIIIFFSIFKQSNISLSQYIALCICVFETFIQIGLKTKIHMLDYNELALIKISLTFETWLASRLENKLKHINALIYKAYK